MFNPTLTQSISKLGCDLKNKSNKKKKKLKSHMVFVSKWLLSPDLSKSHPDADIKLKPKPSLLLHNYEAQMGSNKLDQLKPSAGIEANMG